MPRTLIPAKIAVIIILNPPRPATMLRSREALLIMNIKTAITKGKKMRKSTALRIDIVKDSPPLSG
jgi:hypothetical protein